MSFFHTHTWREQSRHFTGPVAVTEVDGATRETVERLLWGITVVVLKCEGCGDLKDFEFKGRVEAAAPSPPDGSK